MAVDPADPVEVLRRWQDFGGSWRVRQREPSGLTVSLCRCDGGEEVERLRSAEPGLAQFIGARTSSEDDQ